MKITVTAACLLAGCLLAPVAGFAADTDTAHASAGTYVKDSVITAKIKAKLAEEKLSSALDIKVDTDDKGIVLLSGTAKNSAEVERAGAIAAGVEGVVSVQNKIQVAVAKAHAPTSKASHEERVEDRIADMHARLKISKEQEEKWSRVADVMRDNARQMDELTKTRIERMDMNAVDDLKSYLEIASAHVDGMKKFLPVFTTLYESMSETQQKNADAIFRHGGHKEDAKGHH